MGHPTTLMTAVLISTAVAQLAATAADPSALHAQDARRRVITLRVVNDHFEDLRLYLMRGSTRIPIGRIGSFETKQFRIPPAVGGTNPIVQILAVAFGSRNSITTRALDIDFGQRARVSFGNQLRYARIEILPDQTRRPRLRNLLSAASFGPFG